MLVVSRHPCRKSPNPDQEHVVIELPDGRLARIYVVEIRGNNARLAFDVPRDMPVHRSEVWDRIQVDGEDRKNPKDTPCPSPDRSQTRPSGTPNEFTPQKESGPLSSAPQTPPK